MKNIKWFALSIIFLMPLFLAAQDLTKTVLYEGTILTIQLLQAVSSETANVGDILEFETTEPIIIGDRVLVHKGAKVTGRVTEAERRKGMGKAGVLKFTIDYLNLASGKIIKLSGEQKGTGKNKTGAAVAQAVLLTPLFLLKKGKNISFEKGKTFSAFVEKDYEL